MIHACASASIAMALAVWRLHDGLSLVGDSGSYLAGAHALRSGRWFETPLVASFSELDIFDTIHHAGWSPYADFGVGLPAVIALFALVMPLGVAAGLVTVLSIGLIAAGIVFGPWYPTRSAELWMRTCAAVAISCWPILRFTASGVLSEPLFCAGLIWLAVLVARFRPEHHRTLWGLAVLTIVIGTTRFVGPVVALVVALLLIQRGVSWRRSALWCGVTVGVPSAAALLVAGGTHARVLAVHALDTSDVFFTARGVGGWFDAGFGDQTSTLLRLDYQPSAVHWTITVCAVIAAGVVTWRWIMSFRNRPPRPLDVPLVLAVALAAVVLPSMVFLDAVVKLENRILMPSGLLVIGAGTWYLARRAQSFLTWVVLAVWSISATHPWHWLERSTPPRPTDLTEAIRDLEPTHVITDQADLVWWITGVPARYLPDGYHDLSDRVYEPVPIVAEMPCPLAESGGTIVVDERGLREDIADQLGRDTESGRYERRNMTPRIVAFVPTGRGC